MCVCVSCLALISSFLPPKPTMATLETLLILITSFSTVHATSQNACPFSPCGNFTIQYPLKLESTQIETIYSCPYASLTCSSSTTDGTRIPTLNLPRAGQFYVRQFQHHSGLVELYDPGNCLMARLMHNLDLTLSPFKAFGYENYTFYTCPSGGVVTNYINPIYCLSNSTNSTVASAIFPPDEMVQLGCQVIGSAIVPVLVIGQFEVEVNGNLFLTWNSTGCADCEDSYTQPTYGDKSYGSNSTWFNFATSPFFIPAFLIMIIIVVACVMTVTRAISGGNNTFSDSPTADGQPVSTTAPPLQSTGGGMDESKINSCTELAILSENRPLSSPGLDSNTCSICLEVYCPQELVRSIAKCRHSFHAECIEQWLGKNSTCPVCRTMLSDIDL